MPVRRGTSVTPPQEFRSRPLSLREFHDLDYPWAAAWSAWGLATVLCQSGSVDRAGPLLSEALQTYVDLGDPRGVAQCLEALARLAGERASYEAAARLLGCAAAQRGRPAADFDRTSIAAVEVVLLRGLGPHTAERARLAGGTMPIEKITALAAEVAVGDVSRDPDSVPSTVLTRRERQVVTLVASGRTNRQIGRALGIAEKTVEVHLQHVMAKLDTHSRAEVAAWAVSHRLHDPVR